MKGYIVGYFESWSDDRNDAIVGYFTTWGKMLHAVKITEKENVEKYGAQRAVYIVELEPNKMTLIKYPFDWTENYVNYKVHTEYGKTYLRGNDREIEIDIYEKRLPRNKK